ncbi:unnamed protein product [Somion occarium]|uniref:DUF6535 domain-containing protein n=2 Tax=Somion occarium TaxID=3059160 RepID=A0ABP1CVU6_9APHY
MSMANRDGSFGIMPYSRNQPQTQHRTRHRIYPSHTHGHQDEEHRGILSNIIYTSPSSSQSSSDMSEAPRGHGAQITVLPAGFVPQQYSTIAQPPPSPDNSGSSGSESASPGKEDEWDRVANMLQMHDRAKAKKVNGDIDSLLILTGLFSAVVAAFVIDSYKSLQPDPASLSANLLAQIVLHLNGTEAVQAAGWSTSSTSTQPSTNDIVVNVLWFTSLSCALVTASLGIFIKQWVRDYLDWDCSSSQERIRVRHFRYEGLLQWRIFGICAFLPVLLQLAILLFLVGLALFLHPLNAVVAWAVSVGLIIWVIVLIVFGVAPFLSANCPYRNSIFQSAAQVFRLTLVRAWYGAGWRTKLKYSNKYYRFPGDERGIRREPALGVEAVIGADASLKDDLILEQTLAKCAKSFGVQASLKFTRRMLSHRLDREVLDVLFNLLCDVLYYCANSCEGMNLSRAKGRHDAVIEMATCFHAIADYENKNSRGIPSIFRVNELLTWDPLHSLFLDPPRFKVSTTGGAEVFMKLLLLRSAEPFRASRHSSEHSLKNLIRAARSLVDGPQDHDFHPFSITRAVFEYMEPVSNSVLQACFSELSTLVHSLSRWLQAITALTVDQVHLVDDTRRALAAAEKLNEHFRGPGPSIISAEMMNILSRNYTPVDEAVKESNAKAAISPPFKERIRGLSTSRWV